jgi:hypothetical protein
MDVDHTGKDETVLGVDNPVSVCVIGNIPNRWKIVDEAILNDH